MDDRLQRPAQGTLPSAPVQLSQRAVDEALIAVLARVRAAPGRLADILDDHPEPLIGFTARRRILAANPSAERFFGYGRHELDTRLTDQIVPERFRQPDAPPQLATPDLTTVELPGLRRDGSEVPTIWTYGFAPGPDGPIFVLLVRDRVQLEDALEALRESEERFRLLVEGVGEYAIFMLDAEGRVSTWNASAERIKGWSKEDIAGKPYACFFLEEDRAARLPEELLETARMGNGVEATGWRVRKDGSRHYVESFVTPLFAREGSLRGYAVVTHDLTERMRVAEAEQRLALERAARASAEASEERARRDHERVRRVQRMSVALSKAVTPEQVAAATMDECLREVDGVGGAVYVMADDGSTLELLAQAGHPAEAGERFRRIPLDRENPLAEAVRISRPAFFETLEECMARYPALREALGAGEFGASVALPLIAPGVRLGVLGVLGVRYRGPREFSEADRSLLLTMAELCSQALDRARLFAAERRARAQAEALAKALAEANRSKDEFLATMSHELRTPLNSMLGWATILRSNSRDPAKLDRGLEVIERNARAQERLVSDLLDMSRIVSGKLKLNLSRVALWDVVYAAADVVRAAAEGKELRLVLDVDPELDPVVGDPARLQQVLWNLLMNAIRFTPRGGRITVTAERAGSRLQLRVEDTGAGIEPEHLPHIFERFRQVDSSTTRAHGGLGLGLAIVRHIVEAHGGSVEASSEGAGRGATFNVLLPIRSIDTSLAPSSRTDPQPRETPVRHAAADLSNVRVLVVEDDQDSLELVREVLEGAGAEVVAAFNAREALARKGPFDVILSDIGMPEMDGYAMMKLIRSRDVGGDVPAVALTAFARPDDVEQARRAGYQEHLAKPVDPTNLLDTVSRWSRREGKLGA